MALALPPSSPLPLPAAHAALQGLTVLERGWLSSNNVLMHATGDEPGAVLVDSGHVAHAAQTLALVRQALAGQPLARIVNTHLHSDHCGGNALLARELGAPITIPPGLADAVRAWDLNRLGHDDFGQRERFAIAGTLAAGEHFRAAGRRWDALAAPGHDPHSLVLFDAAHGVLISADALWENGFGIVFGELLGEGGFDEVAATLDFITRLPVQCVIPGHGAPFTDVSAALARARSRLQAMRRQPARHARHAAKVLLKYRLMEMREQPVATLVQWAAGTALFERIWREFGHADAPSARAWAEGFVQELAGSGALAVVDGVAVDR